MADHISNQNPNLQYIYQFFNQPPISIHQSKSLKISPFLINQIPIIKQQIQQQTFTNTSNQVQIIKNDLSYLNNHQHPNQQHLQSVVNRLENIIHQIQQQTHIYSKHKSNKSLSINPVLQINLQKQINNYNINPHKSINHLSNYHNTNLITQIHQNYQDLPKQLAQKPFLRTMTNPHYFKPTVKFIKITLASRYQRQLSNQRSQRSSSKGIKVISSLQKNFFHNSNKKIKLHNTQQKYHNSIANKTKPKTIVLKRNLKKIK